MFTGGLELEPSPLSKRRHTDAGKRYIGWPQLGTGIERPPFPTQPLSVDKPRTGGSRSQVGVIKALNRLTIEPFGGLAAADKRS